MAGKVALASEFEGESNDDLIKRLKGMTSNFVRDAVEFMRQGAKIVKELESRGVNTREIDAPFISRMRDIAHGRLLAEIAVDEDIFSTVKALPVSVQKQVVDGKKFPVLDVENPDIEDCRMLTIEQMTPIEKKMALGRTPQEQIVWLRSEKQKQAVKTPEVADVGYRVDRQKKQIVIEKPMRLTQQMLVQMMTSLAA